MGCVPAARAVRTRGMIHSGLVSVTFRKRSPGEVIALVKQAGLRGIEWGGDAHVPPGELGRAREVRELTAEAGLAVAAYGSYYKAGQSEDDGLPFARVLETAAELGAPAVRVWAGAAGSETTGDDARWRVITDSRRIATEAARAGIRVSFEYHNGTLTDTNESASRLLVEADHPNLLMGWQPAVGRGAEECLEGLRAVRPRLGNVHVFHWGATPDDRRPLAEGGTVWRRYLEEIARAPGDRYALLEFVAGDAPEAFLRDAGTLRLLLEV